MMAVGGPPKQPPFRRGSAVDAFQIGRPIASEPIPPPPIRSGGEILWPQPVVRKPPVEQLSPELLERARGKIEPKPPVTPRRLTSVVDLVADELAERIVSEKSSDADRARKALQRANESGSETDKLRFQESLRALAPMGWQRHVPLVARAILESPSAIARTGLGDPRGTVEDSLSSLGNSVIDFESWLSSLPPEMQPYARRIGISGFRTSERLEPHLRARALAGQIRNAASKVSGKGPSEQNFDRELANRMRSGPGNELAIYSYLVRNYVNAAAGEGTVKLKIPEPFRKNASVGDIVLRELPPLHEYGEAGDFAAKQGPAPLLQESVRPQSILARSVRDLAEHDEVSQAVEMWARRQRSLGLKEIDPDGVAPERDMLFALLGEPAMLRELSPDAIYNIARAADLTPKFSRTPPAEINPLGNIADQLATIAGVGGDPLIRAVKAKWDLLKGVRNSEQLNLLRASGELGELDSVSDGAIGKAIAHILEAEGMIVDLALYTSQGLGTGSAPEGLAGAVTSLLAKSSGPDAELVKATASVMFPEAYQRIAGRVIGDFGEFRPGLIYQGANEAALRLRELAFRAERTQSGGWTVDQIADKDLDAALAKGSKSYSPDSARRPPRNLEEGVSRNSTEYLKTIEDAIINPDASWKSWRSQPATESAIRSIRQGNPGISEARAILLGIDSGLIAEPISFAEKPQFEVQQAILRSLWESLSEPNSVVTPDMIAYWDSRGWRIPKTVRELSRHDTPWNRLRVRTQLESAAQADADLFGDPSEVYAERMSQQAP